MGNNTPNTLNSSVSTKPTFEKQNYSITGKIKNIAIVQDDKGDIYTVRTIEFDNPGFGTRVIKNKLDLNNGYRLELSDTMHDGIEDLPTAGFFYKVACSILEQYHNPPKWNKTSILEQQKNFQSDLYKVNNMLAELSSKGKKIVLEETLNSYSPTKLEHSSIN